MMWRDFGGVRVNGIKMPPRQSFEPTNDNIDRRLTEKTREDPIATWLRKFLDQINDFFEFK